LSFIGDEGKEQIKVSENIPHVADEPTQLKQSAIHWG
jgi:hypothetical protein